MLFRREPLPPEPPRPLRWHLRAGVFGLTVMGLICWLGLVDLTGSAMLLLVVWGIFGLHASADAQQMGKAFWME